MTESIFTSILALMPSTPWQIGILCSDLSMSLMYVFVEQSSTFHRLAFPGGIKGIPPLR